MRPREWLPPPPKGTPVCLGFDGSDFSDFTAIRGETLDGFSFTPRWGSDGLPTIWDPLEWPDLRTPRDQVGEAVDWLFGHYQVERMYCDTPRFETDVEAWALRHGEKRVIEWPTYRPTQMFEALERFVADLAAGRIAQDGCPTTEAHMGNARKLVRGNRYVIGKPSDNQKIDLAVTTVLAHEAAADARAAGWVAQPKRSKVIHFR